MKFCHRISIKWKILAKRIFAERISPKVCEVREQFGSFVGALNLCSAKIHFSWTAKMLSMLTFSEARRHYICFFRTQDIIGEHNNLFLIRAKCLRISSAPVCLSNADCLIMSLLFVWPNICYIRANPIFQLKGIWILS